MRVDKMKNKNYRKLVVGLIALTFLILGSGCGKSSGKSAVGGIGGGGGGLPGVGGIGSASCPSGASIRDGIPFQGQGVTIGSQNILAGHLRDGSVHGQVILGGGGSGPYRGLSNAGDRLDLDVQSQSGIVRGIMWLGGSTQRAICNTWYGIQGFDCSVYGGTDSSYNYDYSNYNYGYNYGYGTGTNNNYYQNPFLPNNGYQYQNVPELCVQGIALDIAKDYTETGLYGSVLIYMAQPSPQGLTGWEALIGANGVSGSTGMNPYYYGY